jgi:alpha/beta superfamily hydrolase
MCAVGLEQAVTIPAPDSEIVLEGVFLGGTDPDAGGAVIAPPHPLYGGSLESPVVGELAYACRACGIASLRFNWRGVGASSGEPSGDLADAESDYRAAFLELAGTVEGPVIAAGYSFGSVGALRAARDPRVKRVALISPPPALLEADTLADLSARLLVITGSDDAIAPAAELQKRVEGVPRARFETIDDADHFFMSGLADIGRIVSDWLQA